VKKKYVKLMAKVLSLFILKMFGFLVKETEWICKFYSLGLFCLYCGCFFYLAKNVLYETNALRLVRYTIINTFIASMVIFALFVIRRSNYAWGRILSKSRKIRVYDIAGNLILTIFSSVNIYLSYTEKHSLLHIILETVIILFIHLYFLVSLMYVLICKELTDKTKKQIWLLQTSQIVLKKAVYCHRQIVQDVNLAVKRNEFFIFLQVADTTQYFIFFVRYVTKLQLNWSSTMDIRQIVVILNSFIIPPFMLWIMASSSECLGDTLAKHEKLILGSCSTIGDLPSCIALTKRCSYFSICGLFSLNRKLLLNIFVTVISYSIILYQLEMPLQSC